MKFTRKWLLEYLDNEDICQMPSVGEIAYKLDSIGLEVEKIIDYRLVFSNLFVIAQIVDAQQHPNADRLRVCRVDDGSGAEKIIVCGAENARAGIKVILACEGAKILGSRWWSGLWENQGAQSTNADIDSAASDKRVADDLNNEGFIIRRSKIRGTTSEGMMCSREELGLTAKMMRSLEASTSDIPSQQGKGIIELACDAPVGEVFRKYAGLDDVAFEISLTPNRRYDCYSVQHIANELYGAGLLTSYSANALDTSKLEFDTKILYNCTKLDQNLACPEIAFVRMGNVDIVNVNNNILTNANHNILANFSYKSGISYQKILSYMRCISENHPLPLVNISNFLRLNYGRPNHIYDASKVIGEPIVRKSYAGEIFVPIGYSDNNDNCHKLTERNITCNDSNSNILNNTHNDNVAPCNALDITFSRNQGKGIALPEGCLVIADEKKILSLAGIMGDDRSKVTDSTRDIIVEVATFDPDDIKRSSRAMGIQSDSQKLFGSGLGNADLVGFLKIMLELIEQISRGRIISYSYLYRPDSSNNKSKYENIEKINNKYDNKVTANNRENCKTDILNLNTDDNLRIDVDIFDILEKIGDPSIVPSTVASALLRLGYEIFILNSFEEYERLEQVKSELNKIDWDKKATKLAIIPPKRKQKDVVSEWGIVEEIIRMIDISAIPSVPIAYCNNNSSHLTSKKISRDWNNSKDCNTPSLLNDNFIKQINLDEPIFRNNLIISLSQRLRARGLSEIRTLALVGELDAKRYSLNTGCEIALQNPLNENFAFLRSSMISNFVEFVKNNTRRGLLNYGVYELGKIYFTEQYCSINEVFSALDHCEASKKIEIKKDFDVCEFGKFEHLSIAGLRVGYDKTHQVHVPKRSVDFFDARDDLMNVLLLCGLPNELHLYTLSTTELPEYYHRGRAAAIELNGVVLGYCGEVHPSIRKECGLHDNDGRFVVFEANLQKIFDCYDRLRFSQLFPVALDNNSTNDLRDKSSAVLQNSRALEPINESNFQSVSRDFSFLCNESVRALDIVKKIHNIVSNGLIQDIINVEIIDYYDRGHHYSEVSQHHSKIEKPEKKPQVVIDSPVSCLHTSHTQTADHLDKKSLSNEELLRYSITLRIVFQSTTKTLNDKEIERFSAMIVSIVCEELGCLCLS